MEKRRKALAAKLYARAEVGEAMSMVDNNGEVPTAEIGIAVGLSEGMLRLAGRQIASAMTTKQEQDFATLIDGLNNARIGIVAAKRRLYLKPLRLLFNAVKRLLRVSR